MSGDGRLDDTDRWYGPPTPLHSKRGGKIMCKNGNRERDPNDLRAVEKW